MNGFGVREATFGFYFTRLGLPLESALLVSFIGAALVLLFSLSGGIAYVGTAKALGSPRGSRIGIPFSLTVYAPALIVEMYPWNPAAPQAPLQFLPRRSDSSSGSRVHAGGACESDVNNSAMFADQSASSRPMTRTNYSPAAALALSMLFTLAGCEAQKSETPLSPSVAGPIAGVDITAPRLLEPSMGSSSRTPPNPSVCPSGTPAPAACVRSRIRSKWPATAASRRRCSAAARCRRAPTAGPACKSTAWTWAGSTTGGSGRRMARTRDRS